MQDQKKETPSNKFPIIQDVEPELDWFYFVRENEFTTLELNAEISTATARIEDLFEATPDVAEGGITMFIRSKNAINDVNDAEDGVNNEGLESGDNEEVVDYGNKGILDWMTIILVMIAGQIQMLVMTRILYQLPTTKRQILVDLTSLLMLQILCLKLGSCSR